jgi:hypothetical protein
MNTRAGQEINDLFALEIGLRECALRTGVAARDRSRFAVTTLVPPLFFQLLE